MPDQSQVPTLLLGLGGIGSQIVDRVYGKIPEERRENELIGVHAFDTNVNDIEQLEHLGGHVTQTSAPMRVKDYLHLAGPVVNDWFPRHLPDGRENHILLNKTLTEGAGQIRPVSRLAYRAAMEEGQLSDPKGRGVDFKSDLRRLLEAQGDPTDASLRVMIVCSIVGGTGAGMFLQTALYLRDYLRNEIGAQSFLIRGAFVLPDVLVKSGILPSGGQQEESVMANAYASLKELDAITKDVGPTIELEYKPNQVTVEGNPDLEVSAGAPPFKFSFLYDYENANGQNLGNFESYLRQVTQTVYLQLFSPVSGAQFSDEDNLINNLVANYGGSRYAGAGVATLEYPYEDIVDYCALRWASAGLSDQWLRLDDEYEQEIREWKRDQKEGVHRPKPKIEERYIKLLEMHATEEDPDPFFRQIYESAHQRDEDGRPTTPKSDAFVEALVRKIEEHAEQDDDIRETVRRTNQALQEDLLNEREHARQTVEQSERALAQLEREVKKFIDENKNALFNQAVTRDYNEPGKAGGQNYRLNTWILRGDGAPLHPVAIRYFLYQVKLELDERLSSLQVECNELKSAIDTYDEAFNVPGTEQTEGPEQRLQKALNQGLLGRLFNNKLGSFADLYGTRARSQRQSLIAYQQTRLQERVLRSVLEAVDDLLDQWERYFRNLRDVKERLDDRIQRRAVNHEQQADPTRIFVLATEEDKNTFWRELSTHLASNVLLSDEIAEEIYIDHYDRYCDRRQSRRYVSEEHENTTVQQFESTVVQWCRQELQKEGSLALNVVQALQREARRKNIDVTDHLKEKVNSLRNLATPILNPRRRRQDTDGGFSESMYWGAHPDAVSDPKANGGTRGTLSAGRATNWFGEDLIRDEAFSPYELLCYQNLYDAEAGNLRKFSAGDDISAPGSYYRAYRKRLRRLTGKSDRPSVTPHLDRRWHLPVYLADTINPQEAEQAARRVDQAFLRGLVYGLFQEAVVDKQPTWRFTDQRGPSVVRVHGSPCPSGAHGLHEGLQYNPVIVDRVMDRTEELQREDKRDYPMNRPLDIGNHRFHEGCLQVPGVDGEKNILDVIFGFAIEAPGESEIIEASKTVLEHALEEIASYYVFVYGTQRKNEATDSAANLIEKLRDDSHVYQEADPGGLRQSWKEIIDARTEDLRS